MKAHLRPVLLACGILLLLAGCRGHQPVATATISTAAPAPGLAPAAPAAATATAAPAPPRTLKLTAVGDIMLDRKVGQMIAAHSCNYIVEQVAPDLAADLIFANLESPLSTVGSHDPSNCVFRANPAYVKVLTLAGFNIVSFANNHCTDPGAEGYQQTLQHLDDAGIKYCGAAHDRSQASWLRIMTVRGLKVGFLAFTDLDFEVGCPSRVSSDLSKHRALIAAAKNKCDLLVVSYHWGTEYHEQPTDRQRHLAHVTIDAGADLILGHHPHVLEGIEVYHGHPIVYSMGNFIFDQRPGIKMESAFFRLLYTEGQGWTVKVVPIVLPATRYGPEHPPAEQRDAILHRYAGYCQALGTQTRTESGVLLLSAPAPAASSPSSTARASAH